MNREQSLHRLSHISTLWTMVRQAHQVGGAAVGAAQEALLERYGGAVHRYLLGALRDEHAADELFQEFSLRFIRGDFHRADPDKGRFRDFVKTSLFHLIVDYQRRRKKSPRRMPEEAPEPAAPPEEPSVRDQEFLASWRDELLDRAWLGLAEHSEKSKQLHYDILRFRAANPQTSSAQMAETLTAQLGRSLTADAVRQTLHRAREKFADLLLEEVEASLEKPGLERLEEELIDLGLYSYCRTALERRAQA